MSKLGLKRLVKLAKHIVNEEKRGHAVFDFGVFNAEVPGGMLTVDADRTYTTRDRINYRIARCGTNGCALGECPILFKKQWRFTGLQPLLRTTRDVARGWALADAAKFFGITEIESSFIFLPLSGGNGIDDRATAEQVSNHILAFVARKEKGLQDAVKTPCQSPA